MTVGTKKTAKSGKNSQGKNATGERYLPKKARESLSDEEYARSTAKKRAAIRKGKQFSKQPDDVAKRHQSTDDDFIVKVEIAHIKL